MPSVKRDIIPITGNEAGRAILLDLAKWACNKKEGRPPSHGRKTNEELSDMLYGLQTNDDVKIYNEYRIIQEELHQWWNSAEGVNREATIEWLKLAREFEFIALAAVLDDPMLSDYKPAKYLKWHTLSQRYSELEQFARYNKAQCAAVSLLADELNMPELLYLQQPLNAFRREDAARIINTARERLNCCALEDAMELAGFIAELPEPGTCNYIDAGITRRAKAVMKQKKPLSVRLNNARSVFLGNDRYFKDI